jgi:mevalonate kinase
MDGAKALALPTSMGQSLHVQEYEGHSIRWQALDCHGKIWLEAYFAPDTLDMISSDDVRKAQSLQKMLRNAKKLSPGFLLQGGIRITTQLHFERSWGLGSSSTLVALIAQWAGVDPFALFDTSLTGSGYDVACALQQKPIFYQRLAGKRQVEAIHFKPPFAKQLRFVYLGEKQLSSDEVRQYKSRPKPSQEQIDRITGISEALVSCSSLSDFSALIQEHETILSAVLHRQPVAQTRFVGYPGAVKSMGAWGGDFVLATAPDAKTADAWLAANGYSTVLHYDQLFA